MKIKVIVFFICILLIITSIPITGQIIKNESVKQNDDDYKFSNGDKWIRTYGGKAIEDGYKVTQTDDEGFIVLANTISDWFELFSVWLIKTDSTGNKEWDKKYDNAFGNTVMQTLDGGYVVLSNKHISNFPRILESWIFRTDNLGNILWEKVFDIENFSFMDDIIQTADENYLIIGSVYQEETNSSDVVLLMINDNGQVLWEKSYVSEDDMYASSVCETKDGGFIVTGAIITNEDRKIKMMLLKTNSDGTLLWQKSIGDEKYYIGYSLQETIEGDIIITGQTDDDFLLMKTDSNGEILWEKSIDNSKWDIGFSIYQTDDGGYIIGGGTTKRVSRFVGALIKTKGDGTVEWIRDFESNKWGELYSVEQTKDGGYIFTNSVRSGIFNSDVALIKTNSEGVVARDMLFSSPIQALLARLLTHFPILEKIYQRFIL
jgi:hypothetical protein